MKKLFISLMLILFTIPIHTKISTPKVPQKVSEFFARSKEEISHHEFNNVQKVHIECSDCTITTETWKQPCTLIEIHKKGKTHFCENCTLKHQQKDGNLHAICAMQNPKIKGHLKIHVLTPEHTPIQISNKHGSIVIKNHNGPLDLSTEFGNITITGGNNTAIAKTLHGNITVQRKKMLNGHCLNLQAEHGNITLMVPQDFNADMQAHTQYGKIESALFISLHPYTTLINYDFFKYIQNNIHGWIGQPQNNSDNCTALLCSKYGTIKIMPYQTKTPSKK